MNRYLQIAKREAEKYTTELNNRPTPENGFTTYCGKGESDKEYPHLFNILISLNLQILEKLEVLQELESKQKLDKELDKITEQLVNLSLGKPVEPVKKTTEIYKFWIPRR